MNYYVSTTLDGNRIIAIIKAAEGLSTVEVMSEDQNAIYKRVDIDWVRTAQVTESVYNFIKQSYFKERRDKRIEKHFKGLFSQLELIESIRLNFNNQNPVFFGVDFGFKQSRPVFTIVGQREFTPKSRFNVVIEGETVVTGFSEKTRTELAEFFDKNQGKKIKIFDRKGVVKGILNEDLTQIASYFLFDVVKTK